MAPFPPASLPDFSPLLKETLHIKAGQFLLPEALLSALAMQESRGDMAATRYEPAYGYLWDCIAGKPVRTAPRPPKGLDIEVGEEFRGQKTSWGALQIMGANTRMYGFNGRFDELQCTLGVYYGALHLRRLKERFFNEYGWPGVVAAYNAGSPRRNKAGKWENERYVQAVMRYLLHFRKLGVPG